MGVLDKFLDAIKLNDDYDEEDEYLDDNLLDDGEEDEFLDENEEEKPKKNFFQKFSRKKEDIDDYDELDLEEEEPPIKSVPKAWVPQQRELNLHFKMTHPEMCVCERRILCQQLTN